MVFTGHPSLRFGDVVHFMELWGKSSLNTIIFTGRSRRGADLALCLSPTGRRPSFDARARLFLSGCVGAVPAARHEVRLLSHRHAAQLPPSVKAAQGSPGTAWCFCPQSAALEVPDLCSPSPQPLHVVCPEQYTQPPLTQSHRSDLMLELQPPPMPYRRCSVLNLPFRRRYERVYILPEVKQGAATPEWFGFKR